VLKITAAGSQREFGGGASNAAAIFPAFSKNKAFLSNLRFNFLFKNVFLNDCEMCFK